MTGATIYFCTEKTLNTPIQYTPPISVRIDELKNIKFAIAQLLTADNPALQPRIDNIEGNIVNIKMIDTHRGTELETGTTITAKLQIIACGD